MRIAVSSIPEDGLEKSMDISIHSKEISIEGDAHVHIRVFRFGERVVVSGNADAMVLSSCSRCLKVFSCPVSTNFNVEFIRNDIDKRQGEYELSSGELDVSFYKGDEIDIKDLVREQLLLAVPMKSLCDTDCKGICSHCGANLNEAQCSCREEIVDPRLEKLSILKRSLKKR
jgi:uncharacterized protein